MMMMKAVVKNYVVVVVVVVVERNTWNHGTVYYLFVFDRNTDIELCLEVFRDNYTKRVNISEQWQQFSKL